MESFSYSKYYKVILFPALLFGVFTVDKVPRAMCSHLFRGVSYLSVEGLFLLRNELFTLTFRLVHRFYANGDVRAQPQLATLGQESNLF